MLIGNRCPLLHHFWLLMERLVYDIIRDRGKEELEEWAKSSPKGGQRGVEEVDGNPSGNGGAVLKLKNAGGVQMHGVTPEISDRYFLFTRVILLEQGLESFGARYFSFI